MVDDIRIEKINKQYLGRSGPTNVISFPMAEGDFTGINPHVLGDVVISVETAKRQAEESEISLEEMIDFFLIHGILHLLGYDHERSGAEAQVMRAKEKELFGKIMQKSEVRSQESESRKGLSMESERKIKVLITKVGLDGHDRGAKVVSSLLKEAGMEVVYLGMFQTPENVVRAAIEEDVDVIGLSCLSGEHITFTPRIMKLLKEKRIDGVLFIIGGVIPLEDIPVLKDMGVNEVFTAGTLTGPMIEYIKANVT